MDSHTPLYIPTRTSLLAHWQQEGKEFQDLMNTMLNKNLEFWDNHLKTCHASKHREDYQKGQDEMAEMKKMGKNVKTRVWRLLRALHKAEERIAPFLEEDNERLGENPKNCYRAFVEAPAKDEN